MAKSLFHCFPAFGRPLAGFAVAAGGPLEGCFLDVVDVAWGVMLEAKLLTVQEELMEDKHTFMCGGKTCCPAAEKQADGSLIISDTHADVPSLTVLADARISFSPAQAAELKAWLIEKGY